MVPLAILVWAASFSSSSSSASLLSVSSRPPRCSLWAPFWQVFWAFLTDMFKNLQVMKEFQRNWIALRKAAFFSDKKCCKRKCRSKKELGLSMKNPLKNPRTVRTPWSLGEERFKDEIKKYRVYCGKHLRKRWIANMKKVNPKVLNHGVYNSYAKKGCRCYRCKEAYSARRHAWYLKRVGKLYPQSKS